LGLEEEDIISKLNEIGQDGNGYGIVGFTTHSTR